MSIPSVDLADFLSGDPVKKSEFVQKARRQTQWLACADPGPDWLQGHAGRWRLQGLPGGAGRGFAAAGLPAPLPGGVRPHGLGQDAAAAGARGAGRAGA